MCTLGFIELLISVIVHLCTVIILNQILTDKVDDRVSVYHPKPGVTPTHMV